MKNQRRTGSMHGIRCGATVFLWFITIGVWAAAAPRVIWYEDFDNLPDGVTYHAGEAGWDGESSGVSGYFKVKSIRYEGNNLDKEVVWVSESININYFTNVSIGIDLASAGALESNEDYIKVYYTVDGGTKTLLQNGSKYGSFSALKATVSGLSGKSLKIFVHMYNTGDDEKYFFDNVTVTAEQGALPANTFWSETFNDVANDASSSKWSLDVSGTNMSSVGYFAVRQGMLLARDLGGVAIWKSQDINIAAYSNIAVSADISGFGKLDTDEDYVKVYYKLNGGSEVLMGTIAGAPSAPVTVSVNNLSGSTLKIIVRTFNDIDDERYTIDNITVRYSSTISITGITGGTISCSTPAVTLGVTTNVSNATYLWSGPNNFSSALKNPQVTVAGDYTVTATSGGASVTATTTVAQANMDAPDLSVWSSGILTNLSTSSELSASSSVANVSFTWTGFAAAQNPIIVSTPGVYSVTARNPSNNCTTTRSIQLLQVPNTIWYEEFDNLPDGVTYHAGQAGWNGVASGISGHFKVEDIRYEAVDLDKEVTWTSESINIKYFTNVGLRIDLASEGGLEAASDYVRVYYQLDNGAKTLLQNGEQHGLFNPVTATVSGLSGERLKIFVHVYNTAADEKYFFDNVIVYGDQGPLPSGLLWNETFNTVPDFSKTNNQWSLDISNTNISSVGYFETRQGRLLGRDLGGQAIWKSSVINIASQSSVSVSADLYGFGELDSDEDYVRAYYKLNGGSEVLIGSIAGAPSAPVTVSAAGLSGNTIQIVIRTFNDIENERYTIENIFIKGAAITPVITSVTGGTITCAMPTVTLDVVTNISVTYQWSGPNGFTSTIRNPQVTVNGVYSVNVTSGGASATSSVTVGQDIAKPDVSASVVGVFTCLTNVVTLSAGSTVSGVTYAWSGPGAFTASSKSAAISLPGTYEVKVTNPVNGCFTVGTATTSEDKTAPGATASAANTLICGMVSTTLNGGATTSGTIAFAWTGPEGYTSTEQNPVTTVPGTYNVTVIKLSNGCTSVAAATVLQNNTKPQGVVAGVSGKIDCNGNNVTLLGQSDSADVTYRWNGPSGYASDLQQPLTNVPGIYRLTVTNPVNSCNITTEVTVNKEDSCL